MQFIKKLLKKLHNSSIGNAVIIAVFSVLSKILALLRDRLLASRFGAGDVLDAYYAAFKLPDMIFNTLVLGALSAAFIPVFVSLIKKSENKLETDSHIDKWQLASAIINIIFLILASISVIIFIFAPQIMPYVAPGFNGKKMALTVKLTRAILISIIFFGVSNVFSGVLQSLKKFIAFAIAPAVYNLGIIFGIVFLVEKYGYIGLALGVVTGAFFHMLIQLISAVKAGFRWSPILALRDKTVRKVAGLMMPRTFGLAVGQVNQLIITVIASTLISGSVTVFNFAFNLQSVPISVFAVSLAIVNFPILSRSFAEKNKQKFVDQFSKSINRVLFIIIPISIFMIPLRAQIVRIVLGSGSFDWQDTVLTADSLGYFCLSLFAQGLIPILARAFYAIHDTRTPVFASIFSVIINIVGAFWLSSKMGVEGLALSFSIASIANVILLISIMKHKLGNLNEKEIIISAVQIVIASIGGVIFIQIIKYMIAEMVNMQKFTGVLIQFLISGSVGLIVYIFTIMFLRGKKIQNIF